uniref:Uncharacterized protein n=1 Tax=Steinernema glaseri TaxID=37863 RepID=A0A1I7YXM4_9BILA
MNAVTSTEMNSLTIPCGPETQSCIPDVPPRTMAGKPPLPAKPTKIDEVTKLSLPSPFFLLGLSGAFRLRVKTCQQYADIIFIIILVFHCRFCQPFILHSVLILQVLSDCLGLLNNYVNFFCSPSLAMD